MRTPTCLVAAAGVLVSALAVAFAEPPPPPAGGAKDRRIALKTADDLPRYTYQIQGKPSEFLVSDKPFKEFVRQVKANVEADLAKYRIEDPTALQSHYQLLQQIAMLEGRDADAVGHFEKIRALETKESKRLTMGLVLRAMVAARESAGTDNDRFNAEFKKNLSEAVSALPWDKVREAITQAKGIADILSRGLVVGAMQGQLDPVVAQSNGELSGDLAGGLIGARVTLDVLLPLNKAIVEVYGKAIDSRATTKRDIWSDRLVALKASDKGTPVVVAVWDTGVDVSVLGDRAWTNIQELVNGKDDDGNGFIDDVGGIAFDLRANRTTDLLRPLTPLRREKSVVASYTKGLLDLRSNIESPESVALRQRIVDMKPEEDVTPFMEDLSLFSTYAHGTHVAGIAAEGNPFARVLTVRITFEFRTFPEFGPSLEQGERDAKAAADAVSYMRAAGVRVANMSWGGSRKEIEDQLENKLKDIENANNKNPASASEKRAELARAIFKVERDGQEAALKSAPEILFVVAAGNSDNDNQFEEFTPSGLSLANMITVGAVDQSGRPTRFTSFGKNVTLYANGFEVESAIPGGQRLKFSGTSMAAPYATNLAAKLFALNPKLTTAEVIELITRGADPMEGYPGRFVINPKKSIALLRK